MDPFTEKEIAGESPSSMESTMLKHDQITDIPNTSHCSLPYLFGNREDYLNLAIPLYEASIIGDWETAKIILKKRPDLVRVGLSKNLGTALHVAATTEETELTLNFVKNLLTMMTAEELELQNQHSNTAFWIASSVGNMKMAIIMMEKNRSLPDIRGAEGYLPLTNAAEAGTDSLVKYLYNNSQKMSGDHWTDNDRNLTLLLCVEHNLFDVALQIVEDNPELAGNTSVLEILSRKPDAINMVEKNIFKRIIEPCFRFFGMKVQHEAEEDTDALKLLKTIWGHVTRTMCFNEIEDMLNKPPTFSTETILKSSRILPVAAERGNTRFIVELLRTYPDLMLYLNEDGLTIFHIAVMHRHHGIYNLLYEIGKASTEDICQYIDKSGNNMLHLVGKSSKEMAAKTSGASLLMQRELLWFKEVEKMIPAFMREARNKEGQTPYELFSKENEELVSKGLKWMKDCMVVATLIVTIGFAVAFTVPGGYNQEYAMMATFSASFFVLYHKRLKWVPIFIAASATIPVIVFAVMQFPLVMDMFRSMYDSHYLFKPKKRMLYTTKPRLHLSHFLLV
ncbi:putative ankyrin repeat-containing domain, PGG domain, ankyrin repeat-containing domain superfamily [Helianthus debilis subsp. tardiflorus]